ncbi:hypothetical protein [Shinella zoogloeoides]|uniref:hypothetical protein n=1 Tax=Shinella zoogloeoides TaxID=352475 RepID=UPI00299E09F7|nr:hypothetical protein [Shinella zoogloeoides]WPE19916.1 hypothetical protein ShzoTeo12_10920 [Shinella zoogloeoides]
MAKFTEGPLAIEIPPSSSGFGRAIYARREEGPDVFVAYVGNWKQAPEVEIADAELFAASHEMLAMLIDLLKPGNVNGGIIEAGRDLLARLGHDVRTTRPEIEDENPFHPESPEGRAWAEGRSYG